MSLKPLRLVLDGVDRITAPVRKVNRSIESMVAPIRKVNRSLGMLGQELGFQKVGAAVGRLKTGLHGVNDAMGRVVARAAVVAGAGALVGRSFLNTAAEFERFQTILETVEGSQEGARRAMAWVSDFATRTPFELSEVTDGFVRLKAYGIDPVNGTLESVGDAAAAMGKPLEKAVEALADAVTGENERLKEFGIKARKEGGKIVYEYALNGKQMRKVASANNRAQIEATITGIWNERYAGAMKKLSRTWTGMWSNLMDAIDRFKLDVMGQGVFDFLKGELSGLLERIDAMSKSGELQKLSKSIADGFKATVQWIRETVAWLGGWGNVAKGVGALIGAWLVAPLFTLGAALVTLLPAIWGVATAIGAVLVKAVIALGGALFATPIGWIVGGLALVAGAAYLVYKHWDPIKQFFADLWDGVVESAKSAFGWLRRLVQDATSWIPGWLLKGMSFVPGAPAFAAAGIGALRDGGGVAPRIAPPITGGEGGRQTRAELDGTLKIELDVKNGQSRVVQADSSERGVLFDVSSGPTMSSP